MPRTPSTSGQKLPASGAATGTEAMDQHKEKEEEHSKVHSEEATDQSKADEEEENNSEEPTHQRKEEEEEDEEEGSSEEAMAAAAAAAAAPLFWHPCSLLQYVLRVCACCLGLRDSFSDDPKPAADGTSDPPQEAEQEEEGRTRYFYVQEVITHVSALTRRRPQPPRNPVEGSGGSGGKHH